MDRSKSIKLRSKAVAVTAGRRAAAGKARVSLVTKASPTAVGRKSKAAAQPTGARTAKKEKKVEPIVLSDSSSEDHSVGGDDDDDELEGVDVEEVQGDEVERTCDESEDDLEQVRL